MVNSMTFRLSHRDNLIGAIPHMPFYLDRHVRYPYKGTQHNPKGITMAKRKPTITIEDFNDNWGDAYAKLLRNRKFQQAIHSEKVEDGVETIWLVDKLMRGVLKENKYEAVMAAFDDDVLDAWEYLSGKLPALLDSQSKG